MRLFPGGASVFFQNSFSCCLLTPSGKIIEEVIVAKSFCQVNFILCKERFLRNKKIENQSKRIKGFLALFFYNIQNDKENM